MSNSQEEKFRAALKAINRSSSYAAQYLPEIRTALAQAIQTATTKGELKLGKNFSSQPSDLVQPSSEGED